MIETGLAGNPFEVRHLDAEWLLDVAGEAETMARMADRRRVRLAAQWCVLHEATPDDLTAGWGDGLPGPGSLDVVERLGGPGTPSLKAFSVEPLAARWSMGLGSMTSLLADVLDLVHRLPRIHARVEALEVPVWKARKVAAWTRQLSREAAAWVDAELAGVLDKRGLGTIERVVAASVARFHPDLLADREAAARAGWHVKVQHPAPTDAVGTSWVSASGDSVDLARFGDVVGQIAERLGAAGDTDTLDQRRAKALGLLADVGNGASLEELLAQVAADAAATATGSGRDAGAGEGPRAGADDGSGAGAETEGGLSDVPPSPGPWVRMARPRKSVLHVHVRLVDLPGGIGDAGGISGANGARRSAPVAEVEHLGPATLATIERWLRGTQVRLQPVVDLADTVWSVDAHDPPPRMAELVRLRDRTCVHPFCDRDSRNCDLDHIDPYVEAGPPGQTTPENLAPLCRRHHRCKTSGRWRYRRQPDGSYLWTGPHHRTYLVTRDGTTALSG